MYICVHVYIPLITPISLANMYICIYTRIHRIYYTMLCYAMLYYTILYYTII